MARVATRPKLKYPDWDALAEQFCQAEFIADDPISLPHAFGHLPDWRNVECMAFLAALFSYGRRDKIRQTLHQIAAPLGENPVEAVMDFSKKEWQRCFKGFYYRFNTAEDLVFLLTRLGEIYRSDDTSLKGLWCRTTDQKTSLAEKIHAFRQAFLTDGLSPAPETYGMKFLMADPLQNSAAKRFNMFLRWMVRHDAVDFGLWADILSPSELIFPLDTHVATIARQYRITRRKSNDWKTAEEITGYFRKRCPSDPVRYDFALFGLGVTKS